MKNWHRLCNGNTHPKNMDSNNYKNKTKKRQKQLKQ